MSNWYEILGVSPDATQQEIDEAFARLAPREPTETESEDEAEHRRLVEHAWGVVGNPERRAQYDAERPAAAAPAVSAVEPAPGMPASAPAAPARNGLPLGPILAGVAVLAAIAVVVVALVLVLANDDGGRTYADKGDGEFDLPAMQLAQEDLPAGFSEGQSFDFSNEDWAGIINQDDPESAQRGLEAEGRIRNLLSVYQAEQPGRTLGIFSISTVYSDDAAASRSVELYCGLPVNQATNIDSHPLAVPRFGDESAGFIANGVMSSEQLKETTMCFRTGRVVHALSLASYPGVEDVALAVRLTEKLESRVNDYYDGNAPATTPTPQGS